MAFQPIVDVETETVFAYEALVRGPEGQSAASVLAQVDAKNLYAFDQQCRVRAIEASVKAGLLDTPARLSINFLPNAVYSPAACIQLTLKTAAAVGMPTDRLIFEFTENEEMLDPAHVANIIATYQKMGFGTALDDFGAGHAGLNLLARFHPRYRHEPAAADDRRGDAADVHRAGNHGDCRGGRNAWRVRRAAGARRAVYPGVSTGETGVRGAAYGDVAGEAGDRSLNCTCSRHPDESQDPE
jgi:hypothetical protein